MVQYHGLAMGGRDTQNIQNPANIWGKKTLHCDPFQIHHCEGSHCLLGPKAHSEPTARNDFASRINWCIRIHILDVFGEDSEESGGDKTSVTVYSISAKLL